MISPSRFGRSKKKKKPMPLVPRSLVAGFAKVHRVAVPVAAKQVKHLKKEVAAAGEQYARLLKADPSNTPSRRAYFRTVSAFQALERARRSISRVPRPSSRK